MKKGAWMQFPQQQYLKEASDKRTGRYNIYAHWLSDVNGNFQLHIVCDRDNVLQWSPGWTQLIFSTAVPKASINMKRRWITTIVMWDFQYHMTPREGWWWSKDKKVISWYSWPNIVTTKYVCLAFSEHLYSFWKILHPRSIFNSFFPFGSTMQNYPWFRLFYSFQSCTILSLAIFQTNIAPPYTSFFASNKWSEKGLKII